MSFANIDSIWYIVIASALSLAAVVFYCIWRRYKLAMLFPDQLTRSKLVKGSFTVRTMKEVLFVCAILCFAFTLLRPQWGERTREVQREGTDLLIILDVSRSMLSADVKPTRLDRAKDSVKVLVDELKGDRVGLVLFAGDAFLQCPLTNDMAAFCMFLDGASVESIRLQGTNFSSALQTAEKVFSKQRNTSRMALLITDGEDHEGSVMEYAERLAKLDVAVYTAAIGTDRGDFIPEAAGGEQQSYVRDYSGKLITTKKNTAILRSISQKTGGMFYDITGSFSGIYSLVREISSKEKNQYGSLVIKEREEHYQIFGCILFIILFLELMLVERRKL